MAAKQILALAAAFQSQNLHFLPILKDIMVGEWRQWSIKVHRMLCGIARVCGWQTYVELECTHCGFKPNLQ